MMLTDEQHNEAESLVNESLCELVLLDHHRADGELEQANDALAGVRAKLVRLAVLMVPVPVPAYACPYCKDTREYVYGPGDRRIECPYCSAKPEMTATTGEE